MTATTTTPRLAELPAADITRAAFGLDLLNRGQFAITEVARTWGPAFRIGAGDSSVVVLSGEQAPTLLGKTRDGDLTVYDGWRHWRRAFGGETLLGVLDGREYRRLRSYFNPAINAHYLVERFPEAHRRTRDVLQMHLGSGQGVDIGTLTADVAATQFEATLGIPMSAEFRRRLKRIGMTTEVVAVKGLSPKVGSLPMYRRDADFIQNYIFSLVDQYASAPWNPAPEPIRTLLSTQDRDPGFLTREDIAAGALSSFLAAQTLPKQMVPLTRRILDSPTDLLAEIRDEAASISASEDDLITSLRSLTTVNSVIDESLRLDASALFVLRTARTDFEYEGFRVPRGSNVWIAHTSRHVDPRYFDRPWEFDPGRELAEGVHKHASKAFGHGQRMCPGASLAGVLLSLYVMTLVSRWDVREVRSPAVRVAGVMAPAWADRHFRIAGTPR